MNKKAAVRQLRMAHSSAAAMDSMTLLLKTLLAATLMEALKPDTA